MIGYCVFLHIILLFGIRVCEGIGFSNEIITTESSQVFKNHPEGLAVNSSQVDLDVTLNDDDVNRNDQELVEVKKGRIYKTPDFQSILLDKLVKDELASALNRNMRIKRSTEESKMSNSLVSQSAGSKSKTLNDLHAGSIKNDDAISEHEHDSGADWPDSLQSRDNEVSLDAQQQSQPGPLGVPNKMNEQTPSMAIGPDNPMFKKMINNENKKVGYEQKHEQHGEIQSMIRKGKCGGKSYPLPYDTSMAVHRLVDSLENYIGNVILRSIVDETLSNVLATSDVNCLVNGGTSVDIINNMNKRLMSLKGAPHDENKGVHALKGNSFNFYGNRNSLPLRNKKKTNLFPQIDNGHENFNNNEEMSDVNGQSE